MGPDEAYLGEGGSGGVGLFILIVSDVNRHRRFGVTYYLSCVNSGQPSLLKSRRNSKSAAGSLSAAHYKTDTCSYLMKQPRYTQAESELR